ncbi:MAG: Cytochrome c oxidase polypeptide III, partial [uncultured Acidimicrobiales bacterium]
RHAGVGDQLTTSRARLDGPADRPQPPPALGPGRARLGQSSLGPLRPRPVWLAAAVASRRHRGDSRRQAAGGLSSRRPLAVAPDRRLRAGPDLPGRAAQGPAGHRCRRAHPRRRRHRVELAGGAPDDRGGGGELRTGVRRPGQRRRQRRRRRLGDGPGHPVLRHRLFQPPPQLLLPAPPEPGVAGRRDRRPRLHAGDHRRRPRCRQRRRRPHGPPPPAVRQSGLHPRPGGGDRPGRHGRRAPDPGPCRHGLRLDQARLRLHLLPAGRVRPRPHDGNDDHGDDDRGVGAQGPLHLPPVRHHHQHHQVLGSDGGHVGHRVRHPLPRTSPHL